MSQPLLISKANRSAVIDKLKKVMKECDHLKTELNCIKNMTFKAKRKMDVSIKSVRDVMRSSIKNRTKFGRMDACIDRQDKQNNINASNHMNKLSQIQVNLPQQNNKQLLKQCQQQLSAKILLELQEIKFLQQRENLICKKNERLTNYYSETKKQLDVRRSQVLQNQY